MITKFVRIGKVLVLSAIAGVVTSAADGQGAVGYANMDLYSGTNYIANQFNNGHGNTLDTLFQAGQTSPAIPEGAMFTEWNPSTDQFLPISTYDSVNGWSINYALSFGEGGMLITPTLFTNTFSGGVSAYYDPLAGQLRSVPLVSGSGLMFLSCVAPIQDATFYDVVGRDPQNGEYVTMFNAAVQTLTTTTFEDGAWNNGTPDLGIGESAFFYLEPAPEPSTIALAGLGMAALWMWRRRDQLS